MKIVVSELMWMGSNVSTADEWVEIAAFSSGSAVTPHSVSGWTLVSVKAGIETTIARLPNATLSSGATLVIGNTHAPTSRLAAEPAIVTTAMSLPNTQLLLRLKNASGTVVDEVDDGVGVPMAGANPSGGGPKASMERADPWRPGNVVTSWKTATLTIGFDEGPSIFGTPGFVADLRSDIAPPASGGGGPVIEAPAAPPEPQAPPLVRLTEVMANPVGADTDEWIEIGSFQAESVDLAEFAVRIGTLRFALAGTLAPGGHLRIGKVQSGLTLPNSSGTLELLWRDKVIDTWTYIETVEGVSLGRSVDGAVRAQCVPSPDAPNTDAPLDPFIRIQSSSASSGRASLNLETAVPAGSLMGAVCSWAYPDEFISASCNPPSHSMAGPISSDVLLTITDYCGNTMIRSLHVEIAGKSTLKDDDAFACVPMAFTGVTVSEFFPNPPGDEAAGEWIELANRTDVEKPLCGWSLDDDEGGSDPYRLDRLRLPAGERLLLMREETDIALNNDRDAVRLVAPLRQGGSGAYEIVRYEGSPEGRSFARRDDGVWLWSSTPTPETANEFETLRIPASVDARIVQAMPNPSGADTAGGEWVEIENTTKYPLPLTGWSLQTASENASLQGVILSPKEKKRLIDLVPLANAEGFVHLLDREGVSVSLLAWENPSDGHSVTRPKSIADVSELSFVGSDDCVTWNAKDPANHAFSITLDGIKTENIIACIDYVSALLKEQKFEQEKYSISADRSTVFLHGVDVASVLLREGLAMVDADHASPFDAAYRLDEAEAREERRGMWASGQVMEAVDEARNFASIRDILDAEGLKVIAKPGSGIVESGAVITFSTNVPASIEIAVDSGAYVAYAGGVVIDHDTTLSVRAVSDMQNLSGSLISSISIQTYMIRKSRYSKLYVSEVYPSPKAGESEWVELWNPTEESVSLLGWLIDDAEGSGSKPAAFPRGAVIGPDERLVVRGLSIAWNNDGDSVRLIDPNGNVSNEMEYGSLKKGMAFAAIFNATRRLNGTCVTAHATPGADNRCAEAPKAPAKKKQSTNKAVSRAPAVRYRNVLMGVPRTPPIDRLFDSLLGGVDGYRVPTASIRFFLLLSVVCILVGMSFIHRSRRA